MKEMKTVFKIGDLVKVIDRDILEGMLVKKEDYNNKFGYYIGKLFVVCSEEVLNYSGRIFKIEKIEPKAPGIYFVRPERSIIWIPNHILIPASVPIDKVELFCSKYCIMDCKKDCPLYDFRISNNFSLSDNCLNS